MRTLANLAQLEKQAWSKYLNTCITGGTPEQRQWAFDRWLAAEDQLDSHHKRERKRKAKAKTDELAAVEAKAKA